MEFERVTVFGAGAVGSLIAARLARAGVPVEVVARGEQAAAIGRSGLSLSDGSGCERVDVSVVRPQDRGSPGGACLILCLKAHTLAAAADDIASMCAPDTVLVPVLNGVPWWYRYGEASAEQGPVSAVDPQALLWNKLEPASVVGCVTHVAAEVLEPGRVHHAAGERFVFGEPDGSMSPRLSRVTDLFARAGFQSESTPDIRQELWLKLLGNTAFNPVSVLTGATMDVLCADARIREVLAAIMSECLAVARGLGVDVRLSVDERLRMAERLGAFKTSMLQDVERERSVEIEALVGAVVELARIVDVPVPVTSAVYALTRARAAASGLYHG